MFQCRQRIKGYKIKIIAKQGAVEIKDILPGDHEDGKCNDHRIKRISADAAENLLTDDNGRKSSGDDRPPGKGGRNQHGKKHADKSCITVADGHGQLHHFVHEQFPEHG